MNQPPISIVDINPESPTVLSTMTQKFTAALRLTRCPPNASTRLSVGKVEALVLLLPSVVDLKGRVNSKTYTATGAATVRAGAVALRARVACAASHDDFGLDLRGGWCELFGSVDE